MITLELAARLVNKIEWALPLLHNHSHFLLFLSSIPRIQMWF